MARHQQWSPTDRDLTAGGGRLHRGMHLVVGEANSRPGMPGRDLLRATGLDRINVNQLVHRAVDVSAYAVRQPVAS